jgi:hypothetical protein
VVQQTPYQQQRHNFERVRLLTLATVDTDNCMQCDLVAATAKGCTCNHANWAGALHA